MIHISKAIIEQNNKYLLLKRSGDSMSYPGMWDFAGGKDDPGETPEQSVVREVKEETSHIIKSGDEIETREYHDKKHDLLFHYFKPVIISGELKLSPDHSEFDWFSKDEMLSIELHPAVKIFLEF